MTIQILDTGNGCQNPNPGNQAVSLNANAQLFIVAVMGYDDEVDGNNAAMGTLEFDDSASPGSPQAFTRLAVATVGGAFNDFYAAIYALAAPNTGFDQLDVNAAIAAWDNGPVLGWCSLWSDNGGTLSVVDQAATNSGATEEINATLSGGALNDLVLAFGTSFGADVEMDVQSQTAIFENQVRCGDLAVGLAQKAGVVGDNIIGASGTFSSLVGVLIRETGTDTTPPNIDTPTGTATGETTADGSFNTNEANGTRYAVCTTSATQPNEPQIIAGQDNTGAAAAYANNSAVTATGVQNFSATGLTQNTTYYWHFMHRDAANNNSSIISSTAFTTNATPQGTLDFSAANQALQSNTTTNWANQTGVTAIIVRRSDNTVTLIATGLTTNASGNLQNITNAAIDTGTAYRVIPVLSTGQEGLIRNIVAT